MTDESANTGVVQKWADPAMFTAEPSKAADGPRVYLLSMTPDPLGAIAAACKMYKGEVVRDIARDVTDEEREDYFAQIQRTHLQAPFEFVQFHFLVEGVTRSFTHQMVRQRTAVYAQESLRFAVKEDAAEAVALPPSIYHTTGEWRDAGVRKAFLSNEEKMRWRWDEAVRYASDAYNDLVNMGMPAEDARGLLPHNITTRLHYDTNLRNLQEHAGNRLCTQAQFEWRQVWVQIVQAIRNYGGKCTCDTGPDTEGPSQDCAKHGDPSWAYRGNNWTGIGQQWQYEQLANLFRPICYLTGKCEFQANFDRACSIRDRVEAYHSEGLTSEVWDTGYRNGRTGVDIAAINPAEWLADPAAAR